MTAVELIERGNVVTFKGEPVTLVGRELKIGDQAPDFVLIPASNSNATVNLSDVTRQFTRAVLLIVVPSIDTSVCALETVRFNRDVAGLPEDKLGVYTISVDLPFAQRRWSAAEKIYAIELLSDYKTRDFGTSYGVLIKELALYARSIFLVDKDGIIRYIEVVAETAREPNYQSVLDASKAIIS